MRTEKIRVRMLAGLLAAGLVLSLPAGGALALGEGTFTEETVNSDALAQDQNVQDAKEKKEALQKELDALNQVNPTLLDTTSPPKKANPKPTLKAM